MSAILRSVPPRRTEAREALAEAIERHDSTAARLARLNTAVERESGSLYGDHGAIRAFERAETALSEAKANEGYHLAAVAIGEATDDANPVKLAEHALSESQFRLDGARKMHRALEDQLSAAESELKIAKGELDLAVRNVMRDESAAMIDRILAEAAALQEQLGAKRATLSFLKGACFDGERELSKPIDDYLAAPAFPAEWNNKTQQHPALGPWLRAREALATNADAPLPI